MQKGKKLSNIFELMDYFRRVARVIILSDRVER
jgi:hypothetical protein